MIGRRIAGAGAASYALSRNEIKDFGNA